MQNLNRMLVEGEIDEARWKSFKNSFPDQTLHETLATYASFPIILTSDLLYKIFINFQQNALSSNYEIPFWIVQELIHSSIIKEAGYDLYEIYPNIKKKLMERLDKDKRNELAYFIKYYLENCFHKIPTLAIARALELNYKIELNAVEAINEVLNKLSNIRNTFDTKHINYLLTRGEESIKQLKNTKGETLNLQDIFHNLSLLNDGFNQYNISKERGITKIIEALEKLPIQEASDNGYNIAVPIEAWQNIVGKKLLSEKERKEDKKQKVHGLLVGINAYKNHRLAGCINDVKKIRGFLTQQVNLDCNIEILIDEEATKNAIVSAIEKTIEQIHDNDVFLFYFSGNSVLEEADSIWKENTGYHESLICHDDSAMNYLLADKEIYFIINKLIGTSPHIITIFDYGSAIKIPKREWKDFIFSEEISKESLTGEYFDRLVPKRNLIQIYGQQWNEAGLEIGGAGIFTQNLAEVLKNANGLISYNTLFNRLRLCMKSIVQQQPRIRTFGKTQKEAEQLLNTIFLTKEIEKEKVLYEAIYNKSDGWLLNAGAIHGIDKETIVKLTHPAHLNEVYEIEVEKVYIDFCKLQYNSLLDEKCIYKASVKGLVAKEIKLKIQNHDGRPEEIKKLVESLTTRSVGHYTIVNDEEPDYDLNLRAGQTYLTKPNDPFRPLVKPVELDEEADFIEMSNILKHISRWHFVRDLENDSKSDLPKESIKVEVIRVLDGGKEDVIAPNNNMVEIKYQLKENVWRGEVKIKLTNITDQTLHICAAYLPKDFQVYFNFLEGKVVSLESGSQIFFTRKSKNASKTEILPLIFDDVENEYNWKEYYERIKFIISTQSFDPTSLQLEVLPEPYTLKDRIKSRDDERAGRAKSLPTESKTPIFTGWITQNLDLRFKSPDDKKIEAKKLQEMLEYDQMAYFAAGLYFDIKREHSFGPSELVLKEEIKLQETEQEERSYDSLKIRFANAIESRLRDRRYNKLRDKLPRIVALGDSWFQYPLLVRDILDHLSGLYAIKSLSAAGNTLRNYVNDKEFVKAIEDERPLFFLVSGGGNDILGEQFRGYLADEIDPTKQGPEKYLKNTLLDELDKLMELYRAMFKIITDKLPDVQILCHGYDYLIPVDTEAFPEKKSWLGKYMIEKKISKQQDRVDIITFILDQFNIRMQAVANEFKGSVSYINLLGTTNDVGSWYDEIHPTDEGFQGISMKFISKMMDLEKKRTEVIKEVDEQGYDYDS